MTERQPSGTASPDVGDRPVPRGDRLLRVSRFGPLPRARPQGRPRRRPRSAIGDRRPRAGARHRPGHRGDRRRAQADAVRAGRASGRGRLRRRHDVVSDQRRHPGQSRADPGARQARRPRARPAQLARLDRRRPGAVGRPRQLRRAGVRRRARDGPRRHARGAGAGARPLAGDQRRVHRLADLLRDGGRRRGVCSRRPRARRGADRRLRVGVALRLSSRAARFAARISAPMPSSPRRTRSSAA